jgi:VIT1/CCC1 family predicted Fe2+/Mn2+ transporter
MTLRGWLVSARTRLDVTAGLVDGILNALTLASGRLTGAGGGATLNLTVRIGLAASLTTLFVFFVAHYAELRTELARSEQQLNLTAHGRLASGRLGRWALKEAMAGAAIAAACGLIGAMLPLYLCIILPGAPWSGLAASIILLGLLGAVLAHSFYGNSLVWALAIMVGGSGLTYVGTKLNIAG